jgi:transposase
MLQITPHHRLLLAVRPADFRKGIDSLAALCRQTLEEDPFSGTVFIFTNRLRTTVKILVYDGQGFWLCTKRFSRGRLAWWPIQQTSSFAVNPSQLQILLSQGNPLDAHIPADWRPVTPKLPPKKPADSMSPDNSRVTIEKDL